MILAFSILVHESNECVLDLIKNIKKYNSSSCIIILHVNPTFNFDYALVKDIPNLYINPNRYKYNRFDTQIGIINSNYQYLVDNSIEFDYLIIIPSNAMCIKSGLEDYVKNFDAGFYHRLHDGTYGTIFENPQTIPIFSKYPNINRNMKYIANIEGGFFKKEIFEKIFDMTRHTYDPNIILPCHQEEFLYPILLEYLCNKDTISEAVCYLNLKYASVTIDEIKLTLKNDKLFFVKRVPRIIHDPIRKYIYSL